MVTRNGPWADTWLWYGVYTPIQSTAMSVTMTIRLDDEVKLRLEKLAGATQRSKSYLAAEAIRT